MSKDKGMLPGHCSRNSQGEGGKVWPGCAGYKVVMQVPASWCSEAPVNIGHFQGANRMASVTPVP